MILSKLKNIFKPANHGILACSCNARFMSVPQNIQKEEESSPVSQQKPKKASFMKNTLAGSLEDDFLQFSSGKRKHLPEVLNSICYAMKGHDLPSSACDNLKMLGKLNFFELTSLSCLDKYNVTCTDLLHFYEVLDLNPSLTAILEIHSSSIIPALYNYGSTVQIEKYLKRIFCGEITGAFALTEVTGGSDPTSINISASENTDGTLNINGEKLWVLNGLNADFYIVFVKVPLLNLKSSDGEYVNDLSAFIIDKCSNIDLVKHNLVGLNESGIARVKINNCIISKDNMLGPSDNGYKLAAENLKIPKFISLVCILNQLKKIIRDVTEHVNKRKQSPRDLKQNEEVQRKLKNAVSVAYIFESMLYFTADLLDRYEIDISLESALLQIYGHERVIETISRSMELLGSKAYDHDFPYAKLFGDLKSISRTTPPVIVRLYAALIGLEHAGNCLKETVLKNRNPFNYPGFVFKKMIASHKFSKDKIKYTLQLYTNFHPSLKDSAQQLEYIILRFRHVLEIFLSRNGAEVIHRHIDLKRISEVALEIFSMASILTRASHSYCSGVQNCDDEVLLARSICFESYQLAKETMDTIIATDEKINDSVSLDIAVKTLQKQSYFIEHPLEHDV